MAGRSSEHRDEASPRVRELLAGLTGTDPEDWYLVFKARYGLQVAFRAMAAASEWRSVATQTFTCCTAVDPILALGLEPRYLDVDPDRLAISPSDLEGLCTAREVPLAVVDQHTYGLVDEAVSRELAETAHAHGTWLVEDCAHCPGRMAMGPEGPLADVSVHSFGVEKLLPHTRFGGAVWVNPALADEALRLSLREAFLQLEPIPEKMERACRAYVNQTRVLNHLPAGLAHAATARLIASGKREPGVADAELKGELPLDPMAPGPWVSAQAVPDLEALPADLDRRRGVVATFARALADVEGAFVPAPALDADHPQPLLRFPLFFGSKSVAEAVAGAVNALGLYCVNWYRPLLFPGVDLAAFGIEGYDAWPESQRLSKGVVCLPTDLGAVTPEAVVEAVRGAL